MDNATIVHTIKRVLCDELDLDLRLEDIADDASLGDDGLALDSITMAEFLAALEHAFSIRIPDEALSSTNFDSVATVAALVERARSIETSGAVTA